MADSSTTITKQSWGQKMILETGEDITGQTDLKFIFKNEIDETVEKTATCDDDEVGEIYYVIEEDFWTDEGGEGTWKVIAKATFSTSAILYTRPVSLNIVDQWDD